MVRIIMMTLNFRHISVLFLSLFICCFESIHTSDDQRIDCYLENVCIMENILQKMPTIDTLRIDQRLKMFNITMYARAACRPEFYIEDLEELDQKVIDTCILPQVKKEFVEESMLRLCFIEKYCTNPDALRDSIWRKKMMVGYLQQDPLPIVEDMYEKCCTALFDRVQKSCQLAMLDEEISHLEDVLKMKNQLEICEEYL